MLKEENKEVLPLKIIFFTFFCQKMESMQQCVFLFPLAARKFSQIIVTGLSQESGSISLSASFKLVSVLFLFLIDLFYFFFI